MMNIRKASVILLLLSGVTISGVQADTAAFVYDELNRLVRTDYGSAAYIEYSYDDTGNMTRKTVYETVLLARLAEFTAEMSDGCVILTWKTLSEPDNAGFHILRSKTENGEYVRMTEFMIPAQGDATGGASYSYRDCAVNAGQRYYYRLENIDYKGVSRYDGTVSPFPAEISQNVNTPCLSDVIRILQINAGIGLTASLNLKTDAGNDGKVGMEDAVYLLQVISGLRN